MVHRGHLYLAALRIKHHQPQVYLEALRIKHHQPQVYLEHHKSAYLQLWMTVMSLKILLSTGIAIYN